MARPTASHSASAVPLVGFDVTPEPSTSSLQSKSGDSFTDHEPSKSGHRKKSIKTRSSEVLGVSYVILLDSEDESEKAPCKPSASQFGSLRDLDKEAVTPLNSPGSKKLKHSRKRGLDVEDPMSATRCDSKTYQSSASSVKRTALGVSSDGNFPPTDTTTSIGATVEVGTGTTAHLASFQSSPSSVKRSTLGVSLDSNSPPTDTTTSIGAMVEVAAGSTARPAVDLDNTKQSVKPKSKRKGGLRDSKMQSGTPEHGEQENKENTGSDLHGGNEKKAVKKGKKRKKGAETQEDPESSKRSQSQSDLSSANLVQSETKITSTCHQCRQRLITAAAWCRNTLGKRPCTQKYCAKCLCNRYGEIVEETQRRDTWSCPRCRGICNCSMCMKKKGLAPTGGLAKKAKAAGYASVAELLEKFPNMREDRYTRDETITGKDDVKKHNPVVEPADNSNAPQDSKLKTKNKRVKKIAEETEEVPPGGDHSDAGKKKRRRKKKCEIEASVNSGDIDHMNQPPKVPKRSQRKSRGKVKVDQDSGKECLINVSPVELPEENSSEHEIVIPTGVPLTKVGDLDFPPEAIGLALQILEFCSAFELPLKLKRVKAEKILSEMVRGGTLRRGSQSDLIQLHVQLLSIILDDMDDDTNITMSAASKNCWVYHLERHVSEQYSLLKKSERRGEGDEDDTSIPASTSGTKSFPPFLWPISDEDMAVLVKALRSGVDGYGNLSITTRLQLLAILCDDTLNTTKMRDYLDKVMSNYDVEQKENREELLAVKKQAKERLENDVKEVKAAKRDNLVPIVKDPAKVESEATILADKEAQLTETAAKLCGPRCDALRTEPEAVHKSGSRFWRVKGAKDRQVVLLQDLRNLDRDIPEESWSVYPEDREEEILQCITTLNSKKTRRNMRRWRKRKAPVQADCIVPATVDAVIESSN